MLQLGTVSAAAQVYSQWYDNQGWVKVMLMCDSVQGPWPQLFCIQVQVYFSVKNSYEDSCNLIGLVLKVPEFILNNFDKHMEARRS